MTELNAKDIFKILENLENNKNINNFIITTHVNPDGDAIGSALGMFELLVKLNKKARIINISPTPDELKFLDKNNIIELFDSEKHSGLFNRNTCTIIVDLNDPKRLGKIGELCLSSGEIIVIDHHLFPKAFANHYFMDVNSASTAEMIWKIWQESKQSLSKLASDAIYVGIMTDTGSFRYDRTVAQTFRTCADLLDQGADPEYLYNMIYNRNSYVGLKLLGVALNSIELHYDGKLAIMPLPKKIFKETGASEEDTEGFSSQGLKIEGVKVAITITELASRDELRISFRSRDGISIRELAEEFGGGGHGYASGARAKNSDFDEIKAKLIESAKVLF